jgi:hypothetical protein
MRLHTTIFFSGILTTLTLFSVNVLPAAEAITNLEDETSMKKAYPFVTPEMVTLNGNLIQVSASGDTVQPRVISTFPTNKATDIPLSTNIKATFSEQIQPSTVSTSTFQVRDNTGKIIPGKVTKSTSNLNALFKPLSPLVNSKVYTVIVTTDVKDLAGNPLFGIKRWSFTTVAKADSGTNPIPTESTQPTQGTGQPTGTPSSSNPLRVTSIWPAHCELRVGLNPFIKVTFNKPVAPSTVNTLTFLLKNEESKSKTFDDYNVPGKVTVDPTKLYATFVPEKPLAVDNLYSVTITDGIGDPEGKNRLVATGKTLFVTTSTPDWPQPGWGVYHTPEGTICDSILPPRVVDMHPHWGYQNVPITEDIYLKFSKPLQASTVNTLTIQLVAFGPGNTISKVETQYPLTLSEDGKGVGFFPKGNLMPHTKYEIRVNGVKDLGGNPNVTLNYPIWSFTTQ